MTLLLDEDTRSAVGQLFTDPHGSASWNLWANSPQRQRPAWLLSF